MENIGQIEIAGLVCRLRQTVALGDVTLRIAAGTVCGVAGPNGAGKTTLLRAIAGAIAPQAGSVLVAGRDPHATPASEIARLMATLPQRPVAPAGITVREAVAWGRGPQLGRLSRPGIDDLRAVDQALADTGVASLADRPLEALSGGELHRVLIARALAQGPRVLLLDEPTVHLDIAHQVGIMELLRAQAAGGLTVVAALHDLNLAASYCDSMVLLTRGRLLAFGDPAAVVRADLIKEAYGATVAVRVNPGSGRPYVVVTGAPTSGASGLKVHVICGGGTGAEIMRRCVDSGYQTSAGVVHVMDTDDETARALGVEVVEAAPFSPLTEGAIAAATRLARAAQAVVVAPVPFGPGNLGNLEVAAGALANKVPVFITGGVETRDFTDGLAARRVATLVDAGAVLVPDVTAALDSLRHLAGRSPR